VSRLHMPDNNLIEQDHRSIKLRLGPMLGLKRFQRASITIAGIELIHRIRKGQFKLGKLCIETTGRQKSGMLFSPHEPCNVPERFVALIPKVCTRAVGTMPMTTPTEEDLRYMRRAIELARIAAETPAHCDRLRDRPRRPDSRRRAQ